MEKKQSLLLHICCAPDQAWALELIKDQFKITCFFSNSNIFPLAEYEKRLEEVRKVSTIYNIPCLFDDYVPLEWETAISNFEDTKEGGLRCKECFTLRMKRTAQKCKELDIELFATVMSVSPHKNVLIIDSVSSSAAENFGVNYRAFNFKKNDGFKKSVHLSQKLNIYRQNYCGCRLSLKERDLRMIQKQQIDSSI